MSPLLRHLPNMLTVLRLCAAPLTAYFILRGEDTAALVVFGFAGLSDAVDGYLARRLSPGSRFGVFLDPAADKLLMLASFVTLTAVGVTPMWLTVLVIARDLAIVVGLGAARLLALPLRIEPLTIGKASTVVQVMYVAMLLILRALDIEQLQLAEAGAIATGAVTLASGLAYGQLWLKAFALSRRTA